MFVSINIFGQTNVQEMYDINREHLTTTVEHFNQDKTGSNFFFIDIYHKKDAPTDMYMEASRSFRLYKDLSVHFEYNGGFGVGYKVNNAYLAGFDYFIHSKDFKKTLTLSILYKNIYKVDQKLPLQLTAVWTINDIFNINNLTFSSFADLWFEDNYWNEGKTHCTFLSEPQLWYSFNKHLSVGGEVEVSCNFSGNKDHKKGWQANPALGLKYNF